jgi:hypothetical protein
MIDEKLRGFLKAGIAIPASPLALTADRKLDERHQRAIWRYYIASGCGGVAVGVHTTQFAIRDPKIGLFKPILELAREEMDRAEKRGSRPLVRIAGICGKTEQAVSEASLARDLGYSAGLLSLAAMKDAGIMTLIDHCQAVADVIPIIGFYLQPAVGGRILPYEFWERFARIQNVVAIKIAPFNRYQTLDVMRAVAASGRDDIALYTGNDDSILMDLLTPYPIRVNDRVTELRFVGGLLGHWSVWTKKAVELLEECRAAVASNTITSDLLARSVQITDCNAAFFDSANGFAGCIAGLHEILRRRGLMAGTWCLDPNETMSPGQLEAIERVYRAYPHLNDDEFVDSHISEWLAG